MRKAKKSRKVPRKTNFQWLWLKRIAIAGVVLLVAGLALLSWLMLTPIDRNQLRVDAHVSSGQGARGIANELNQQGLKVNPTLFVLAARLTGRASQLKAGRYELPEGISVVGLVEYLSKGQGVLSSIALIEGQTARALLLKLRSQPDLIDDYPGLDHHAIATRMQLEGGSLEGWIYPDTYKYSPGSSLSELLERAVRLQKLELEKAWQQREPQSPLKTPYEALKMASIVEKETGLASDRGKVASVFVNRLRVGMLLQTDPTVIYGVGEAFDGNLTRKHLQTDTPYNSYTRAGLPPTPIATPGKAALFAALNPEKTPYFYFVAKGDGSSYFSKNLNEHNNAVRKYQLGR
ncbi:MAG: endolytic transglycosylase MltG [Limnobacter sp.]|uniref:endolytic transglycosylase MltG n=1 Tax=Limnobacter sp. TaxID=2003368 RepID=UPI0022CB8FFF|nr:endolytic transglycosylase MltG [Limnobacter sp.]MCZ8015424.1 endolytic transglycosylase MltG [Limnobacter sp.]